MYDGRTDDGRATDDGRRRTTDDGTGDGRRTTDDGRMLPNLAVITFFWKTMFIS